MGRMIELGEFRAQMQNCMLCMVIHVPGMCFGAAASLLPAMMHALRCRAHANVHAWIMDHRNCAHAKVISWLAT